ncbi:probable peptide/nitrate transporter At3g43790 [Branchiostoma floridae]|uniref:Probable peptide/nitrate transporter At3g43790 n=1 Tax=Branchiostoma floridae TaxID=7739 RepID=A0A9J7MLQ5_BRAFL|nr:probable peptide/nitrate transporter At3g43790 [Branchiostoma floridae]
MNKWVLSLSLFPPSFSFLWTVGVQFFEGLLNGKLGVAKTYLYEICPPKFHSLAFSIIGTPSSVAHFVGPVLGGFLACPATRFPMFDRPVFKQFPYLLPCAVVACLQLALLIVGCIFLGESLDKNSKPRDDYISLTEMSDHEVAEEEKVKPHRE